MATSAPLLVGISRCLMGDAVRWNGADARWYAPAMEAACTFHPVCPEVELGMGVPREPIHLARVAGDLRLQGVSSGRDWTDAFHTWAVARVAILQRLGLVGFILKSRSPSCGLGVPVHGGGAEAHPGLFAHALQVHWPALPLVEASALQDPEVQMEFVRRMRAEAATYSA